MISAPEKAHPALDLSRRTLLRTGTVIAAIGFVPGWASAADTPFASELYVFRAPNSGNAVIGLTTSPDRARYAAVVRLHAGAKTWTADLSESGRAQIVQDDRIRIFSGRGMMGARLVDAVVLELDALELTSSATLDVWAEILRGDASRQRIGNPFVAELVQRDRELAQAYHRISPADDRAILTSAVTRNIAEQAQALGMVADSSSYARRLAEAILPDVIRYTPSEPVGFSYARQNGRHPAEKAPEIAQTILGGTLSTIADERGAILLDRFPYLISPTNLT